MKKKKKKKARTTELTRVVGTANSNLLANVVLDLNTTNALNAKLLGKVGVGQVKLAVLALETTDGLTSGTLGAGPLGLLVTSRASVRAHGVTVTAVTRDGRDNVVDHLLDYVSGDVLDTRPATKAEIVERDGPVVGWERTAVDLAIGEVGVDASAAGRASARGARAAAAASSLGGRAGSLRGTRLSRRRRSLDELGGIGSRSGSWGGSWSGSRG